MDTLLQADALDGVDVLSGVSLEELEELLQADGGLGAPAQWAISPTTAAVTAPALRCLDTDHPAGCARCVPPPGPDERHAYALNGVGGHKALRASLLITPEWHSTAARQAAAAALRAAGDAAGAAAVLRKRGAELNKGTLLALCHAWGYRSHCWTRRCGGKRARRDAAPAPALESGETSPARTATTALALSAPCRGVQPAPVAPAAAVAALGGLLARCCAAFAGPATQQATLQLRTAGFGPASVEGYAAIASECRRLAHRWRAMAAEQSAWAEAARAAAAKAAMGAAGELAAGEAPPPACVALALHTQAPPAAVALSELEAALSLGARQLARNCAFTRTVCGSDGVHPSLITAQREFGDAFARGLQFAAAGAALLAQARAAAPLEEYISAAAALMDAAACFATGVSEAFDTRACWAADALAAGTVPLRSTADDTQTFSNEVTTLLVTMHATAAGA